MSNLEWLRGEVVLPAPPTASVRRAFRTRHNHLVTVAYELLKGIRQENITSSESKWAAALAQVETHEELTPSLRVALHVARSLERPRACKWEDFEDLHWGLAGVGATSFPLFSIEGNLAGQALFKGRTLTWQLFPARHAVADFLEGPDGLWLDDLLEGLPWVRGTGGGLTRGGGRAMPSLLKTFGPQGRHSRPWEELLPFTLQQKLP